MKDKESEKEIEEYKLAFEELRRCSEMFWKQADFFLLLNTALITLVGVIYAYTKHYLYIAIISLFGFCISMVWLFHGSRIARYMELTEEYILNLESSKILDIKIKTYQKDYFRKKSIPLLERHSSSTLRKIVLPCILMVFWFTCFIYLMFI